MRVWPGHMFSLNLMWKQPEASDSVMLVITPSVAVMRTLEMGSWLRGSPSSRTTAPWTETARGRQRWLRNTNTRMTATMVTATADQIAISFQLIGGDAPTRCLDAVQGRIGVRERA